MTLKSGLEVTQGHSNWYHSTALMLFPMGYRQKATEQKATGQKATDKRQRQKATGQKATERNVKMLLSCQDVLERLRVVLKRVEQIVLLSVLVILATKRLDLHTSLVCRSSLFVVYLSSVLMNCSTTATVCRPIGPNLSVLTANN